MPTRFAALAVILVLVPTVAPRTAAGQSPAARGAVVGGTIGAIGGGLAGALFSRAICDAADCSDAWLDGAAPGTVLFGMGGALIGAGVGAVTGGTRTGAMGRRRIRPAVLADFSAARAESESIDQTVAGGRVLAGIRYGGLVAGPNVERLTGSGWRVSSAGLAARLDPGAGSVRPFLEAGAARFDWRYPGIIVSCTPGSPPDCSYTPGIITDDYLGAAGAVGLALGDRSGRWAVHGEVRFHYSGSRPGTEIGSTTSRLLRQVSVGASVALGR